jgi:hypothetical protein
MSPEDRLVGLLSRWLAGHLDNARLRAEIAETGRDGLSADQSAALDDLVEALERAGPTGRGGLEREVREALEALALG